MTLTDILEGEPLTMEMVSLLVFIYVQLGGVRFDHDISGIEYQELNWGMPFLNHNKYRYYFTS